MPYEFPIKASRDYICPPDAAPEWRSAYEAGFDMAELEDNLKPTPEQRLDKHQQKLDEHFKREEFLESLQRGLKFIQTQHVHTR
jgi:hypothetical protein